MHKSSSMDGEKRHIINVSSKLLIDIILRLTVKADIDLQMICLAKKLYPTNTNLGANITRVCLKCGDSGIVTCLRSV
jgi:hypothetical protein